MGIPMTRYSLLSKLMRKGHMPAPSSRSARCPGLEKEVEREARDIQNKYSLYAFVLCDYRDERFREHVTDLFSCLDRRTGTNLLFFSLVKPLAKVEYRLKVYYDSDDALAATDYYPVNDALYQHALLEAFQVSSVDLPAIVVTTSLESSQWNVIPVADAKQASQWLMTLGKIADDIADGVEIDLADELNLSVASSTCSSRWYAVEGVPVCELIAAVEAAAALSVPAMNSYEGSCAKDAFSEVCGRLKASALEYSGEDSVERNADIIRLVKYLEVIASPSPMGGGGCLETMFWRSNTFEKDTLRYLEIFEELSGNPVMREMGDYTVLCSLLHKIFESEINASVLQLMRKNVDIPMPEFYDKFYPDSKRCYVQRPEMREGINLNRYIKGEPLKYVSPGLGKVLVACRILSKDKASFRDEMSGFGMDEMSLDNLCHLWDRICQIRNREAHCQVITEEQYHELFHAVSHVMQDYQLNLFKMKSSLRGVTEA